MPMVSPKNLLHMKRDFSPIGTRMEKARNMATTFNTFKVMHVGRDGNVVAHKLAKHGVGLDDELIWVEDCPEFVKNSHK
ncbi:hypothetical protein CRYUN_Cryun29cG0038900 [Craigia yunnanensis]